MSGRLSKTDSEVSSVTQTSPSRSPRRPVYYVQSPSRDSRDEEKTTNSFHSTPVISPMGSPPHSHSNSSLGPHSSRESSSTRLSGSLIKPHRNNNESRSKAHNKPWMKEFDSIEEECLLDDDRIHTTRRRYLLAFVVCFFMLFSVFSLILWGASRPQRPTITMKSILFEEFAVQAGSDFSGVATEMVSMNCTVKLIFHNAATFFGVHVTSTPLDLFYSQLAVATGTIQEFYQSRKNQRSITVTVKGNSIPLYGGGSSLSSLNGAPIEPVALTLNFMARSRAYVLGKLVKPKFYTRVACSVVMDPKKMNVEISLKNDCTYN
ncbi:LEA_2 domain-containing protein [Cephalotus follicularis]|uniref:LEA_2 domain-containing protein n=1 Tax=Cephalotus follicularis TaxID=3775 RepID=A0A1Q3CL90_CEPFO|nr:LEA_2 domain-containing protein [Cephalotus follicularis]